VEATAHSLGNPSLARRGSSSFAQQGSGTWAGWTLLAPWRDVIPLARPPLLENEGRVSPLSPNPGYPRPSRRLPAFPHAWLLRRNGRSRRRSARCHR
jgi:hypothetical protein